MERRVFFLDDARAGREVGARRGGASDFMGKPSHREQLLLAVEKALERQSLAAEVRDLRIRATGVERDVVSVSSAMGRVLEVARAGARHDPPVPITGGGGAG